MICNIKTYLLMAALAVSGQAGAQLSTNPDKFLGNITTDWPGSMDYAGFKYSDYWNQVTPENGTKWSTIEGTRGQYNWYGADPAYNYAKNHNFPFKFHCLVWGAQYPTWMDKLTPTEQYKAIEEWMDAVKQRYPDLPLIDVVNEAIAGHNPAPYSEALGGEGRTGYDWIIKAFEMAHERWPDAILIYNDFNTFQWQRNEFINLVKTLRDAGAPIDAYGCQSHDLTDMNVNDFKTAMTTIQNALKIPMYTTEYDIGTSDDSKQLQRYKEQIPYMWEADYCAGITLWGYIYGKTWTTDGNSGIIRNGVDRPAMTWLRQYMATDNAKNAKSPFPGMKKEASVYVKPSALSVTKNEPMSINVRARLKTKTIDHVDVYVKNKYLCTMTEAPYICEYTPTSIGRHDVKAVVTATDSSKFERLSGFTAFNERKPFKTIELPGTLQAEDFDIGGEGLSFHDSDSKNDGTSSYRTNSGGVDIVSINGNYVIGYIAAGEWLEYTVDVKEAGLYSIDVTISSESGGGSFTLSTFKDGVTTKISEKVSVPKTNSWNTYRVMHTRLAVPLEAGRQVIRLTMNSSGFNIDKLVFKRIEIDQQIKVTIAAKPAPATINEPTSIQVTATSPVNDVASVRVYANDILVKNITSAPFETDYTPTSLGETPITAIAVDADGRESEMAHYTLKVNNKRTPYKGAIDIPGTIEAENFDKGGEGLSYHDSDTEDQGKANYRSDNGGVDIVKGGSGYVIGYTANNEWLDYTVNVKEPGKYTYEATVSSGITGSSFIVQRIKDGTTSTLFKVTVPQTGNNSWDTYKTVSGNLSYQLEEGEQVLRIKILNGNCNIDKIKLNCVLNTGINDVTVQPQQSQKNVYNLSGQKVGNGYRGIVIVNGKKMLKK